MAEANLPRASTQAETALAGRGAISMARALWRVAAARVTSGNVVRLLVDGPDNFAAMHALIANARESIDLEQYYWKADDVGRGFTDALVAAAQRGVRVRVLVDWYGAHPAIRRYLGDIVRAGGEVRVFNRPGFRRWLGLLPRDHRKLLVADNRTGITGGIGIGEVWGHWRPLSRKATPWRDTGVEIHGPAAIDMTRAFLVLWKHAGGQRMTREERRARLSTGGTRLEAGREPPALVGIVEGVPGRARVARALQVGAVSAESSLWVASAYFLPSYREAESLLGAARDGVDVRVLVPNKNDQQWVTVLSRRYYRALLRGGVRIWEWNGPMMHAKTSVIDGRITRVGSTDLNPLGVAINYEIDAYIDDPTVGAEAAAQFLRDLSEAREVLLSDKTIVRRRG